MALNLGFHYHIPALAKEGEIYIPGYLGCFIDSLAQYCAQVVCFMHSPLPEEQAGCDYRLRAPNVSLVDIGLHVSIPRRMLSAHRVFNTVRPWRSKLDAILLRGPSPLLPIIAGAAGDLPLSLLIVGDYLAGIDDPPQPRWRKDAIRLWSLWNKHQQDKVARHSLTFVNSRQLFERMRPYVPRLVETRTTTLTADDFYERKDTCLTPPYHLLYTGRMSREKGLFEMVTALAVLVEQGRDVVLDLVGWPEKGDNILQEIQSFAQDKGIAERIRYHGYKPVGPELFAYYKQADIYLMPSYHEGFPRTIWEAMANSVPVIATKVGSIPYFLKDNDNALLVEPRDIPALSQAIQQLLDHSDYRQGLIRKARLAAQDNILEKRSHEMIMEIEKYVRGR